MRKIWIDFSRPNAPLRPESHTDNVEMRDWSRPFMENAVCVIHACTELLIANLPSASTYFNSSKYLLIDLVCTFHLTICFRMVRSRHLQPCFNGFEPGLPKHRREPRVSIGDVFTGQSVDSECYVDEYTSTGIVCDRIRYSNKAKYRAVSINELNNSSILAIVFGKAE